MKIGFSLLAFSLTIGLSVIDGLGSSAIAQVRELPALSPSDLEDSSLGLSPFSSEAAPLKPGDRLRLTVIGFPEVSGEQTIMADGGLQLPFAGYLNVWGLTPSQATETITAALTPYIRRAQVSIAIDSLSPTRVSVTGAVARSGPLVLGNSAVLSNRASTLSEALSLAGGVTPDADLGNILVRRHIYAMRNSAGSNFPPYREMTVDLWQSIRDGDLTVDLPIYDGDEIIVPASTQLTGIEQQDLLSSTVAPNVIAVNVGGEVNRPGIVEISPDANVSSAVAAAGGLTENGTARNVVLFRTSDSNTTENYVYDLGEDSVPLRHGDSIIVSRSTRSEVRSIADIISRVLLPFNLFRD